jgi:hypothetical protein
MMKIIVAVNPSPGLACVLVNYKDSAKYLSRWPATPARKLGGAGRCAR